MDEHVRNELRKLVAVRQIYQKSRIQTDNVLSLKADGTVQKKVNDNLSNDTIFNLVDVSHKARELEVMCDKEIAKAIKGIPLWEKFLKGVKGVGPMATAVILSEFDIEKATTVSKLWQFAGLNPGRVQGRKYVDGVVVKSDDPDDYVRGDRQNKGYLNSFNSNLRCYLLGVLAPCMIKVKSPYTKYYYNMKERLSNSSKPVNGDATRKWRDEPKMHIDKAAKRYMIKIFLQDLYREWRTIEGLPVREPYQVEYLGHVHGEA